MPDLDRFILGLVSGALPRRWQNVHITNLPSDLRAPWDTTFHVEDLEVQVILQPKNNYTAFTARVASVAPKKVFLSLKAHYDPDRYQPFNYNGVVDSAEVFRQSPHDINAWIVNTIAMQAVPVAALKSPDGFEVAVSDAPFRYDNFTTQAFYPLQAVLSLNSGDNADTPGLQPDTSQELNMDYNADKTQKFSPGSVIAHYHKIEAGLDHEFSGIIFHSSATDYKGLRKDISLRAADHFSHGKYSDYFGALSFTSAYYNLRTNDSGKSKYWVVPAVEYGNTQYGRDAFWISTILPAEYASECIKSELAEVNHFAEYPLFAIIWAYRAIHEGFEIDKGLIQRYVDAIEKRAQQNSYYSYWEGDGRLDFQYWGDVIAFEKDDVIAYNQGLFALAIEMADQLGLQVQSDPDAAATIYQEMFNEAYGFVPVSRQKLILSPDALVPDLLAQLYLDRKLLPTAMVQSHFDRMVNHAKTSYGFKIVSSPDGSYLPASMYDVPGYQSQVNREQIPDGSYFRGGSYFLYDNLFLIDAYLHGIEEAEDLLLWRVGLDFEAGATTFETLNTKTGEPWKPNMGWNVAIYSFWRQLVDSGKADQSLFEYVDSIVKNENE